MNERIKLLAEQAGLRFTQLMSNPMVPVVDGKETDLEKFAESIVQECARTAAYFSIENKRIHPDIDPREMPDANRMVYHATCQSVAEEIRLTFRS
jgi:hypothetical protein